MPIWVADPEKTSKAPIRGRLAAAKRSIESAQSQGLLATFQAAQTLRGEMPSGELVAIGELKARSPVLPPAAPRFLPTVPFLCFCDGHWIVVPEVKQLVSSLLLAGARPTALEQNAAADEGALFANHALVAAPSDRDRLACDQGSVGIGLER